MKRGSAVGLALFMAIGIAMRLLRFGLHHPLWRDEAYLAWNVLDRDYAGLTEAAGLSASLPAVLPLGGESGDWCARLQRVVATTGADDRGDRVPVRLPPRRGTAAERRGARRSAVAILAIGYTPVRHGGEFKPYATDFLVALGLIGLAVEWVRTPGRARFLWALAALGPLAVGLSNPSIFVAGGVGLVLTSPVLATRSTAGDRPARGVRRGDSGDVPRPADVGQCAAERERHAVDAGLLGRGVPAPFAREVPRLAGEGPHEPDVRVSRRRGRRREHADDGDGRDGGRGLRAEGVEDGPRAVAGPIRDGTGRSVRWADIPTAAAPGRCSTSPRRSS